MNEWKESKLDTLCEVTSSKRIFSREYINAGIPFYRSKEIIEKALGNTITENLFISTNRFLEVKRQYGSPQAGDILISSVGVRSGIPYLVKREDGEFYFKDGNLIWIKSFSKLLRSDWLLYWLKSDLGQENLRSTMIGSAQPALTIIGLSQLLLKVPPSPEQKSIASILSSLDDKIELNRRMNETLEAMARAIFKDWFVDFGPTRAKQEGRAAYLPEHLWSLFPEAIDRETGLPIGWENKSIDELFNVSIGRTPPRKESQHFITNGEGKPWLSIKTMGNVQTYVFDTEENLTKDAVETFRVPLVPQGTVMISFKLTVGRIVIAGQDMYTNEAIAHLVHLPSTPISPEYIYCFMKHFDFSQLGSTSSIATAVNSKSIKQIKVSIPRSDLCNEFDKLIKPIFEAIRNNVLESRTLAELRDRLLPKLMSGEIRVKDAEKLVEEVM